MKSLSDILLILLLIVGLGTLYFMFISRGDFSTIIQSLDETKTQIKEAQRINTEAIKSLSALQSEIRAYEEDIKKLREARDSGLLTIKRGNENALEKLTTLEERAIEFENEIEKTLDLLSQKNKENPIKND
ncbi:hypothetical protein [Lewinella sp. W8]|uniref:hypothetical protein n=1 Tax=Lewinella sp. W8 TaxID=2528208 RepID=UPI0010682D20|nr:hypothetical protein [Lewinella sp. W8]MTB51766.1 hypothetical protein [Lewinella sp. W8]